MKTAMGMRVRLAVGVVFSVALTGLCGCNKEASGSAPAGSASAASAAARGGGAGAVTLKTKDVQAAYEAELNDMKKMNDPMDKKIAAFEAKVGKPQKEEGGKKIWHATDGSTCTKFTLETSGALEEVTVDKSACGL
ncbi:MAG: hypothetical protein IPM35_32975 [Myxococcales bacterium]|nr:hypothetical protein [Myxococcales bacterium]